MRRGRQLPWPPGCGRTGAKLQAFGVYYSGDVPTFGEDLAFLAMLIGQGRLDPLLGATASWTAMAEVLGGLKARKFSGKAVFTVD